MWLVKSNFNEQEVFSIYGKALFISQKFEIECKDIIRWFQAVNIVFEEKVDFMSEEYVSYCEKLSNIMLGRSIESIKILNKRWIFPESEIQTLITAKDSRNWIVHESCIDNIALNVMGRNVIYEVPKELKNKIIEIIKGDYIVSKWSYEFHEKESAYFFDEEKYIQSILNWLNI